MILTNWHILGRGTVIAFFCRFLAEIWPNISLEQTLGSSAMLAAKRSAGVAPKLNPREFVTHMHLPSTNKAADSGFETQRRHHQESKTGVSVAPQEGHISPPKILKRLF